MNNLGAYWPARQESVEQCAVRLDSCLTGLAACDPALATWYNKVWSRKAKPGKPVRTDRESLIGLLNKGRNRLDSDHSVIEVLGFGISLWNGGKEESTAAEFNVTCGLYSTVPGLGGNNFLVSFPDDLGSLASGELMRNVLEVVARSWEPDWAGIYSNQAMRKRHFDADFPFVDWVLYLSDAVYGASEFPPEIDVQRLDHLGRTILVQSDPPQPNDTEHLARVHLIDAGIRGKR